MENKPELIESESYPNGSIKTEEFLIERDGETLVLDIEYFENGVKFSETLYHPPFQSGQREGFYIISYNYWREDGQVDDLYIVNKPHKAIYDVGDIISYKTIYDYYDNGQVEREDHYKELFTDIAWGSEDDPERVKSAKMYPRNENISHGKHTSWYENGQIKSEQSFKDNEWEGKWTSWYENGQLDLEDFYKNGYSDTGRSWYKDGKKLSETIDGKFISWYENGQKCHEGKSIKGKQEGKWTSWYENGQIEKEESFKDNKWDGKHTYWYENGQKKKESRDVKGKYEGKWTSWYENGQKWEEGRYKKEKKEGRWTEWDENGKIIAQVIFKDGVNY